MVKITMVIHNKRLRTRTEGNANENWRPRAGRARGQRLLTAIYLLEHKPPELPVRVTFTRLSSGKPMDCDNLPSAIKHIRDQVCAWLGCGDGPSDPVTFRYQQEKAARGYHAVRIEIERQET